MTAAVRYGTDVAKPMVHQEIERKLDPPAMFRLPALPGATPLPRLLLTATYYDTADLRLARHRITLRRRTGGGDDGWHLKLPHVDDITRDEVHVPLTAAGEPPAALGGLVLGITRGAPLVPVATLRNDRRPVALVDAAGLPLAELTDDRVSVLDGSGDGRVHSRFREIEVEAAPGRSADDIQPVVTLLVDAGAREGSFASKAVRALGPRATEPPDVVVPDAAAPGDAASLALHHHIARQVVAIQAQDMRVRRGLDDSVHQMRVAIRRLRSTLRAFAPLFSAPWAEELRNELGWMAAELGAARDAEVLQQHLLASVAELRKVSDDERAVAQREIVAAMSRRARAGRTRATKAMHSPRYLALLDALVQAAAAPEFEPAAEASGAEALLPLVKDMWRELATDVDALRRKGRDEPWHEARIQAKRVRYAAEAVSPVFGKRAARFARRVGRVTEVLGRHQDAAIAAIEAHAIANRAGADPAAAFVLGRLHDAARAEVVQARRDFLALWPAVADPHLRRWLRPG